LLYAEFRRHLGKAGMTINDFAAYLGIRPASVSNHSKVGSVPRTYAIIAILLGEAADRGVHGADLLGHFGIAPRTLPAGSNVKQMEDFRASRAQSDHRKNSKAGGSSTSLPKDDGHNTGSRP
jgi:hypothetical protein